MVNLLASRSGKKDNRAQFQHGSKGGVLLVNLLERKLLLIIKEGIGIIGVIP